MSWLDTAVLAVSWLLWFLTYRSEQRWKKAAARWKDAAEKWQKAADGWRSDFDLVVREARAATEREVVRRMKEYDESIRHERGEG